MEGSGKLVNWGTIYQSSTVIYFYQNPKLGYN